VSEQTDGGGGAGVSAQPDGAAASPAGEGDTPLSYEAACARVEEIVRRLDSGQAGLRETLELVGEGRSLIEFCASELDAVSGDLEELRLDELVARLEGDHGNGAP
jgi:exodeoxyribonuclease VII small subunit